MPLDDNGTLTIFYEELISIEERRLLLHAFVKHCNATPRLGDAVQGFCRARRERLEHLRTGDHWSLVRLAADREDAAEQAIRSWAKEVDYSEENLDRIMCFLQTGKLERRDNLDNFKKYTV